jgi:peptidoglycan/LPS O-acetylase OafA/YrhL
MRNNGLDAVRGVAILLVVASHLLPASIGQTLFGENRQLASEYLALSGVILFFVLSGYLIEKTTANNASVFSFAVRRAARILPMYWTSVLFALFSSGGAFDMKTVVSNALFLCIVTYTPRMLGVYWTLYIEVLFYALVPVLRLGRDTAIKIAPYAAVTLAALLHNRSEQAAHLTLYVIYCLMGMQLSLWRRSQLGRRQLILSIVVVACSASLFTPGHPLVGLIVLCGAGATWFGVARNIESQPLAFIGRVSYSWYLLHMPIGNPVLARLIQAGWPDWSATVLVTMLTLGTAVLTFYLLENPCNSFGKTIAALRSRRDHAPGAGIER